MRITILLNNNIYATLMFEDFIKENKDKIDYVYVFPSINKKRSRKKELIFILNLYGFRGFVKKLFNLLHFRLNNSKSRNICKMLESVGLPMKKFSSPKDKEFIKHFKSIAPEIVFVALPHLIPDEVIKIPKIGMYNKHSSLLPSYKGVYPVFWQMLNKEKNIGISIHQMTNKIDGGKIIYQKSYFRDPTKSFDDNYLFIIENTSKVLSDSLKHIRNNTIEKLIDTPTESYYSFPSKSDIRIFKALGNKII